jgi:hypothetical protein
MSVEYLAKAIVEVESEDAMKTLAAASWSALSEDCAAVHHARGRRPKLPKARATTR